jgi:hypothetical protein
MFQCLFGFKPNSSELSITIFTIIHQKKWSGMPIVTKRSMAGNLYAFINSLKHHPEFAESLTAISYMDFDEVKEWEKLSIPLQMNMKEGVV